MRLKRYKIEETIYIIETSTYYIDANSEADALENFRQDGENTGSCATANPEGVTIEEVKK